MNNKFKIKDRVRFKSEVVNYYADNVDMYMINGAISPLSAEDYCIWLLAKNGNSKDLEGVVVGYGTYQDDDTGKRFVRVKYKLKKHKLAGISHFYEKDLIKIKKGSKA